MEWVKDDLSVTNPTAAGILDLSGKLLPLLNTEFVEFGEHGIVLLIAEGIDGYEGQQIARRVIKEVADFMRCSWEGNTEKLLRAAVNVANNEVRYNNFVNQGKQDCYCGTDLTIAYIGKSKALIAHVGVSRVYLVRNEIAGQITNDNNLWCKAISEGYEFPVEMRNVVLRTILGSSDLEMDFYEVDIHRGDKLILATRQLWCPEWKDEYKMCRFFNDLFTEPESRMNHLEQCFSNISYEGAAIIALAVQ